MGGGSSFFVGAASGGRLRDAVGRVVAAQPVHVVCCGSRPQGRQRPRRAIHSCLQCRAQWMPAWSRCAAPPSRHTGAVTLHVVHGHRGYPPVAESCSGHGWVRCLVNAGWTLLACSGAAPPVRAVCPAAGALPPLQAEPCEGHGLVRSCVWWTFQVAWSRAQWQGATAASLRRPCAPACRLPWCIATGGGTAPSPGLSVWCCLIWHCLIWQTLA